MVQTLQSRYRENVALKTKLSLELSQIRSLHGRDISTILQDWNGLFGKVVAKVDISFTQPLHR